MLEDYDEDIESPYKAKPKFKIVAECIRCEEKVSEELELSKDIEVTRLDSSNNPIEDVKVYLKEPDGKEHKTTTDENGVARFEDLIPGIYHIRIEEKDKNENDGLGTTSAAGSNDKSSSSSSANEPGKKILNPQWKNSNGETINKALVDDEVLICAETSGISDGTSARVKIVEKDDDGNDDEVTTLTAKVQNGKIECKWKVLYTEDNDDTESQQEMEEKGYTLPEYAFTVECDGVESDESGQLDVRGWIKFSFTEKQAEIFKNCTFYLYSNNWKSECVKIENNKISFNGIPVFSERNNCKLGVKL